MPAVVRQGRVIATCDVCGAMAHMGYGPLWACFAHKVEVEATWERSGGPAK